MAAFQMDASKEQDALPLFNHSEINLLKTCPDPVFTKEADVYKCFFDYNGQVHNSEYLNFADQILPKEVSMQKINLIELQFKLEIKNDEPKVLLGYSLLDHRHIITVRNIHTNDFHAGIILTEES